MKKGLMILSQFSSQIAMVGNCGCNESPEFRRMVELAEMAQFMDDNIVGELFRQKRYFVIKIEIPLFGTAAPTGL
jgi:hypothetical protein